MLAEDLKSLLASSYAFTIKAQYFHWNVEGPDFYQLHEFFQDVYEEVYASIDTIAEHIRTLDEYTPGSFERFAELTVVQGQILVPRAELMLEELLSDCEAMINLLNDCFSSAENEDKQGVADYIAGRIDAFNKHQWMLRSFTKKDRA